MFEIIGAKVDAQSLTSLDDIGSKLHILGGVFLRSDSIPAQVVGLSGDDTTEVCTGSGAVTFGENCLQVDSILDYLTCQKDESRPH